ncbi:MAG: phage major capsid protein, partial [Enterococcus casseliflavus]|nr:phage major capsid protein [Enterococcus casseliflavus]
VTFANLNNVYGSNMPFINVDHIIESVDVPENKLIAFVGGEYEATQSRPEKVYVYKETFAMKRATLYAIDMLGNGYPTNNDAAQVYDLDFTPAQGGTGE